jgi:hypothetical protein
MKPEAPVTSAVRFMINDYPLEMPIHRASRRLDHLIRTRAAWGGIAGPGAFAGAWLIGGTRRPDYSAVADAISRLAAVGAPHRGLMTAGFVGFGVGVPVHALALRASVPGPAWMAVLGTGLATLAVAAAPLDASPRIDRLHNGFAALGYVTLAATPLLAARPLAASGHPGAAAVSMATGVASGICLAASRSGCRAGLLQRLGLTLGDVWLAASAAWILSGGRTTQQSRSPAPR